MKNFNITILILVNFICLAIGKTSPIIYWNENANVLTKNSTVHDVAINYRLPNDTIPIEYDIDLNTKIHIGDLKFNGIVKIKLKVLKKCKSIVIHSRQLTITKYTLINIATPNSNYPLEYEYKNDLEFSIFTLKNQQELNINEEFYLTIEYNGLLRTNNGGFYRSLYQNENNVTIYLASTQFESTDARHGFPCYDEPALKAVFNIKITHGDNYKAISNMQNKSLKTFEPGYVTTTFETTPIMSTYLVAFIVSDFKETSAALESNKNFIQRVFSRPQSKNEQNFALMSGLEILSKISNYLNVDFSLPKMDQVAVPDFAAGAMENWGLVTYREELLLYNNKTSTISTKTGIATTISHEYGHQWFGNLVSPKWWTYIWLNEGFASLFAYLGSDMAFPEWNLMEYFIVAEFQRALSYDSSKNPRPMTHYVQKPIEIISLFDSISYSKGACVLRMMQHFLTEDLFKKAITKYLNKHAFGVAEEIDLFQQFQIVAKENSFILPATIDEFMGSWTRQGGYPLLTVTRNYESGSFEISQQRYTVSPDNNTDDKTQWYIPYNYVSGNNPDFSSTKHDGVIMKKDKQIVIDQIENKKFSSKDWLILNKQSSYYYRINYDEMNWKLIIEGLKKDHKKIHSYNRAQLLYDAFHLSKTKHVKLEILFDLLTYVQNDDSFAVWSTVNSALSYFNEFLHNNDDYQKFIQSLVKNIYENLGINDKKDEKHFDKYTRTIAVNWACASGIKSCLESTNKKLLNYVEKHEEIEPNLKSSIFCNGLKAAKDSEFNYLYMILINSKDQAERQLLMSSLGCSQNQNQLNKFIESSISSEVNLRQQERINILRSAYSKSDIGFSAVVDFLMTKYNDYADLPPGFSQTNPLSDDIIGLAGYVVDKNQQTKMEALVEKVKDHPKLDKKLKELVDGKIKNNLIWVNANKKIITDWLIEFNKEEKKSNNSGNSNAIAFITILIAIIFAV